MAAAQREANMAAWAKVPECTLHAPFNCSLETTVAGAAEDDQTGPTTTTTGRATVNGPAVRGSNGRAARGTATERRTARIPEAAASGRGSEAAATSSSGAAEATTKAAGSTTEATNRAAGTS